MRRQKWTIGTGLLIAVAGCAGSAVPAGRVASTKSAIRAAEEVGAEETPKSSLHLKYARDQYEEAQQLAEEGREKRASWVLERAEADAELALALARESDARGQAEQALEQVRELQREMP